jgi:hypothetical protein
MFLPSDFCTALLHAASIYAFGMSRISSSPRIFSVATNVPHGIFASGVKVFTLTDVLKLKRQLHMCQNSKAIKEYGLLVAIH